VWFDVRAIAGLLEATGPVRLPNGSELSADNAIRVLLSEAYAAADDTDEGQAARRAALRAAADAVLGGLLSDTVTPAVPSLASSLARSVNGRHLSLWAADPAVQADLLAGGLAGEVSAEEGDLVSFAVQNFGGGDQAGNKLDYYARRQVTVDVLLERDEALVEQRVALRNTSPARGLPQYVAGGVEPGTSRNHVTLAVPEGAQVLGFARGEQQLPTQVRVEADHEVLTDAATLAPGAETSWLLRYRIPLRAGAYSLKVVPQPLAVDAGVRVEIRAAPGVDLRGTGVKNDRILVSGPLREKLLLEATAYRPGFLHRVVGSVRRFWSQPVPLP
jgi:hypothetical protein